METVTRKLTQRQKNGWYALAGLVGVFALFVGYILFTTDSSTGRDDPEVQEHAAIRACEDMVRDQLKAPATADFNGSVATGVGPWEVTGSVDAENSFGAMIRTDWTCTVRLDSDDMFRGRAVLAR